MNKNNAKQFLPLVQALADGKTIQERTQSDLWYDMSDVAFLNSDPAQYRIKPEPRERWVVTRRHNAEAVFETRGVAQAYADIYGGELRQYREVL